VEIVMNPREAAANWLDRGFHPVPVPFREKGPVLKRWQELRVTKDELDRYFHDSAQNIGVLLGDGRGTADIDCDCLEAVAAAMELAPPTGMVFGRESKPASHYIYRSDPDVRSRKFVDPTDKRTTIVELRSKTSSGGIGFQTVVPPSVHNSGEQIRFEVGCDGDPAEVNARTLTASVDKVAAAAVLARHWPKEGSRHDAFLALAGILSRANWPLADAMAFHRALYRALWPNNGDLHACEKEVESTYKKQAQAGETTGLKTLSELLDKKVLHAALSWMGISPAAPVQVIEWMDIVPFVSRTITPLSAKLFPGFLGEMVEAVSTATETPIELAGLLGISIVSACIAKKVIICPEIGYKEPANIFTAVGMESGNRKTSVLQRMARPFVEWEHAEADRLGPDRTRAISYRKTQEAQIDALRKKAARAADSTALKIQIAELEDSLPTVPVLPRLWVQDVTPEQLAVIMAEHGERIALLSDEGGVFDLLAGRYTKGAPNLDVFLQAHSDASIRIDRGSRPPILMRHPALTVGISPQPQVLQNLADQPAFRGRGLLARFLYGLPPSPLGDRDLKVCPVPASVEDDYVAGILRLLKLESSVNCYGEATPWSLCFSPAAYGCWKEFQRTTEVLMKEGGKLCLLRDWTAKLAGAAARLAAILHSVCSDPSESHTIEVTTTEQALNIATRLIDHTLAVFDLMQRDTIIESAERIVRWLRKQNLATFTVRDCFCAHQAYFRKVDALHPALHLLEQHGYVRLAPKSKAAGRPSETYRINPKLLGGG
jgi:hypothetical protein